MDVLIDCVLRNTLTLCEDNVFGKNCTYIAFEKDGEKFNWSAGFQSGARFGRISYRREDGTEHHSDHLVLKVTPQFLYMKHFSMLAFFNEVFFFTRIQPFFATMDASIDHLFPKYYNSLLQYHANTDEGVIVFENLQAAGYLPSPKTSFLDYDHLRLMMRKLGQFHAFSYHAREQNPIEFHAMSRCMVETNYIILLKQTYNLTPCLMRGAEPILNDPHYNSEHDKLLDKIDRYDEIIRDAYTDGDESKSNYVLCHGDFLRNNVLFKYDSIGIPIDLKMVDLANWRFASPAIDITLVLYVNADQKMRNEHWNDLIDEYFTALQSTFPSTKVPSKESILAEIKSKAIVAFFIDSFFLPTLIAEDNADMPGRADLLPEQYWDSGFNDIPLDILGELYIKMGGEKATNALINVLRDLIKRGFL